MLHGRSTLEGDSNVQTETAPRTCSDRRRHRLRGRQARSGESRRCSRGRGGSSARRERRGHLRRARAARRAEGQGRPHGCRVRSAEAQAPGADMSASANGFGPVQMLVVGFETEALSGKVLEELTKLREADIVRLVDLLVVAKDDEGDLAVVQATDLTQEQAMEFGALVGALVGLGTGDEETMEAAAVAGAEEMADSHLLDDTEVWYVADAIPPGTTAAIALLEHRWAIPFRDAILDQGGIVLADEWIHAADLVAIGAAAAATA